METKARQAFDYDQEKAMLIKKTAALEGGIGKEVEAIRDYLNEYGKNILVITGSLLATYMVVRILARQSKENKVLATRSDVFGQAPQQVVQVVKEDSAVMKQIKMSIALFLIGIAKQKLQEFLQNQPASK